MNTSNHLASRFQFGVAARLLLASLGAVAAVAHAHARAQLAPAKPAAAEAAAAAFATLKWEDLVPKDWDPLKDFRDVNLGTMRDGDPRTIAMMRKLREAWDNAPVNAALDGRGVRLPGFVVPLEEAHGVMKEFLLVPYYGACIHSPPPPSNQTIHVVSRSGLKGMKMMDAVWVSGAIATVRNDSFMGVSSYRIEAAKVEPYQAGADKK